MNIIILIVAAIIVVIIAIVALMMLKKPTATIDPAPCPVGMMRISATECIPIEQPPPQPTECVRGTNVTSYGTTYDACDVEQLAFVKCAQQDTLWAYDALWDARTARGYNCGSSQTDYMGNTPTSLCNKAIADGSISYEKIGCSKN